MKVLIVLASLDLGGAQRLVVTLLRHFDREQVAPLLALSSRRGALIHDVPIDVPIFDLGRRSRADFGIVVTRLVRLIRRERPDVVLSVMFHGNVIALAAARLARTDAKIVISEHVAYTSYERGPALPRAIGRACYAWADCAIGVSSGVTDELVSRWRVPRERTHRIFNAIDLAHIRSLGRVSLRGFATDGPTIVAAGRFTKQKGFHDLVRAFAMIRRDRRASLVLLGEGEETRSLEDLVRREGLETSVFFAGADQNPYRWMSRSSLFVLSSLYEGFALVLVEALGLGLPVIATDCPHGPAEILERGRHGLLVPPGDDRSLANAIVRVLDDPDLRLQMHRSGLRRAQDFDAPLIAREYESLFERMAGRPATTRHVA